MIIQFWATILKQKVLNGKWLANSIWTKEWTISISFFFLLLLHVAYLVWEDYLAYERNIRVKWNGFLNCWFQGFEELGGRTCIDTYAKVRTMRTSWIHIAYIILHYPLLVVGSYTSKIFLLEPINHVAFLIHECWSTVSSV